jgi:phosphate:Na+ symporter
MIRKIFLPIVLGLMAFAFWYSPNFKEIAAGVAVFLFGMIALEHGFRTFAEGPLKKLLKKATNKFYKSLGLGIISTTILQSSSLISVICISFISAGLLDLIGGIGIIFGANIGTTTIAWLISLFGLKVKISAFAMPMLVFGVILFFQKNITYKGIGNILSGLGFLFLGIHFMKEGFDAYAGTIDLEEYAMSGIGGLIVFTGLGLVATVILQSSGATVAIILTALAASQITYFNALSLAIGANIGTTITAIIGAYASNAAGKRIAGAHVIFNMVTALVALIFIYQLSYLVDEIAIWINVAADNYTLKLAIFHTIFNVLGVAIMYPFVRPMARFLEKYITEKDEADIDQPKYLSEAALMYPQSAIGALLKETQHLFDHAFEVISHGLQLHRTDIRSDLAVKNVIKKPAYTAEVDIDEIYLNKVKTIYGKIIEFATMAQKSELPEEDIVKIYNIKEANRCFVEVLKDMKELQPKVVKYLVSDNEYMRNEYDDFRKRIVKVIREVFKAQEFEVPKKMSKKQIGKELGKHIETRGAKIEKQRQKIKEYDVLFNGALDRLIRKGAITSEMASSLLNDSAYVASISKNLMKAAELLYIQTDLLLINGVNKVKDKD